MKIAQFEEKNIWGTSQKTKNMMVENEKKRGVLILIEATEKRRTVLPQRKNQ